MRDPLLNGSAFWWHATEYSDEVVEREYRENGDFSVCRASHFLSEARNCGRGCLSLQAVSEPDQLVIFSLSVFAAAPRIVSLSVHAETIRLIDDHATGESKKGSEQQDFMNTQ